MLDKLKQLEKKLSGDLLWDMVNIYAYSTDSSSYREAPIAIAYPKNERDLTIIVEFALENSVNLIPRTAGTSLAGQVVGSGLIVDVSKYMNRILEINAAEKYAIVEPGVIRDELNIALKPYSLFFAPETSTSNRCGIGGMFGNNSCGANSLIYGSTREHVIESRVVLSDGSIAVFGDLDQSQHAEKLQLHSLEGDIYRQIDTILQNRDNRQLFEQKFPDPQVKRRNGGYALDLLCDTSIYGQGNRKFNFNRLLAGSEGTLALSSQIKIQLHEVPKGEKCLLCVHVNSVIDAARANIIALKFAPVSVELMDKLVMDLSKENKEQAQNRFFIHGDPGAILIVEFQELDRQLIDQKINDLSQALKDKNLSFHNTIVRGGDMSKVWALRKAGLGVLANIKGDEKAIALVEDTAIRVDDLPDYLEEVEAYFQKLSVRAVYYAHISTGEIHIRPIINIKTPQGRDLYRQIGLWFANVVKKYRGSLSGEHGDGRLRGEFIPVLFGDEIYSIFRDVKRIWDPKGIFNREKIVDTPPMNTFLRYDENYLNQEINTIFDFDENGGFQASFERCNGAGDCRKSEIIGGTMCPSFQASKNEYQSTRARANVLREVFSKGIKGFENRHAKDVLDLCLSCKACKSECPSNVDITKIKAEFLNSYYSKNGIDFRTYAIAYSPYINRVLKNFSYIYNKLVSYNKTNYLIAKILNLSTRRNSPKINYFNQKKYLSTQRVNKEDRRGKVILYIDEFTKFNDGDLAVYAVKLIERLGYEVIIESNHISGRTFLSKGLLGKAKQLARKNVIHFSALVNAQTPIVGIEPSAILSFRDEYPDIVGDDLKSEALKIKNNCFSIEEWLAKLIDEKLIDTEIFTDRPLNIAFHAHCYQKALSSSNFTYKILNYPINYKAVEIKSGCCGMAGSFGMEDEHYDLSMKIGQLILFPSINEQYNSYTIAANGTSCRHQIKDGTKVEALHPVQILYQALK